MKHAAILVLVLLSQVANSAESSNVLPKVKSHVQFYFGEYISTTAMYHWQPPLVAQWAGIPTQRPSYRPMFSPAIGFDYKAELSKHFGLRTGINYLWCGSKESGLWHLGDSWATETYTGISYISYFNIPLRAEVYVTGKHGRMILSAGPDMNLALTLRGNEQTYNDLTDECYYENLRARASRQFLMQNSALGFTAGIGYEKKLRDRLAIEIMPEVRLLNALPFNYGSEGTPVYISYPFCLTFGVSTYVSFY